MFPVKQAYTPTEPKVVFQDILFQVIVPRLISNVGAQKKLFPEHTAYLLLSVTIENVVAVNLFHIKFF